MILLEEQVVLDPRDELMLVICLRKIGLVIADHVTRTAGWSRLEHECEDDTQDAVDDQNHTAEDMHATSDTGKTRPEREMDQETSEDKECHAHQVDPVGNLHR